MSDIAIIGDRDIILGFKALGLYIFAVEDDAQVKDALARVKKGSFAACYITEKWARRAMGEIDLMRKNTFPVITIIPDNTGSSGLGQEWIKQAAVKAIGTDALFKGEDK